MDFCNAAAAAVGAAEFFVLVHDVQASSCLGVGSVGSSKTFILIFNDDDDDDDDNCGDGYYNDYDNDRHILTVKFSDYG